MLRKKVSAKKKIEYKALVEQRPIVVMLRKKESAKMIEDKALAKKTVADDESGRAQQPLKSSTKLSTGGRLDPGGVGEGGSTNIANVTM